nr:glycoside hydrolase family 55 protein [Paenibacillus artemisiicola]
MELEGNVLTITNGSDIYSATDDDFVLIDPSRATIQIAPLANAQFIGKFHSIAVGEKSHDNDLVSKNGLTKAELIPLINNAPQILSFNNYVSKIPNWVNITRPPYNAAPNSDITTILQNAINNLTRGTIYVPDGDYLISQTIKLKPKVSMICGNTTVFKPSAAADNFNMFEFPVYQVQNDRTTFTGLRINGLNKNVIGIKVFNAINLIFYDCIIENCQDTGLELNQSQFNQFYNLILFNNKIGLFMNAGTGNQTLTGGNSNTFYNLSIISNIVGCLVHHVSGNYFYMTIPLGNRVSCFAFFDCLTNYIHGGCPEATGNTAPNPASIDMKGKTIKKATIYSSNSILCIDNLQNNDATVKPSILLENESVLDYGNPRGYGQPSYSHVACDFTSSVSLTGKFDAVGNFENVSSVPSALIVRSRNAFLMKDNTKYDKYMLNAAVNPLVPSIVKLGTGGIVSVSNKNDTEMGSVKAVKFSNRVTVGTDKAVIYASNIFPNGVGKKYSGLAVNLKTDVDTLLRVELGEPNGSAMDVKIKAGEWKRVCLFCSTLPNYNVFFCPLDNAGAELLVTRLCSINTDNEQVMLKLLQGYFNDNSNS